MNLKSLKLLFSGARLECMQTPQTPDCFGPFRVTRATRITPLDTRSVADADTPREEVR